MIQAARQLAKAKNMVPFVKIMDLKEELLRLPAAIRSMFLDMVLIGAHGATIPLRILVQFINGLPTKLDLDRHLAGWNTKSWKTTLTQLIVCVSITIVLFICHAGADIYRFKDENGVWHFTNIPSDRRYRLYIKTKGMKAKQYLKKYDALIHEAARRFGVEANLVRAIIKAESSFDPNAISESGAQGLMQLMPGTADEMRVIDPFDPEENIFGGTRYLSLLLERFDQDKQLAVAAYNGGATRVAHYNSVPPIPQTRRFVEKVMKYYEEFNKRESQDPENE